jgi:hypothetical protein
MPDELTDEDWRELLAYLLDRLRAIRADDAVAEILVATAEPVKQGLSYDQEHEPNRLRKTDLSRFRVRPRLPRERFHEAMNVLHARLIELPAVLGTLERYVGAPVEFVDDNGRRHTRVPGARPAVLLHPRRPAERHLDDGGGGRRSPL